MARLLIVDDEQGICWGLTRLAEEMGHEAEAAVSAEAGLRMAAENRPDAIVLDIRLPGMDGLAAMEHFHSALGPVPIIVITAHGDLNTAVEAVRNGAFDYLTKPFDLDVAQRTIQRALQPASPAHAVEESARNIGGDDSDEQIVGKSPAMQEVFKRIALVAASDACVHLRGESGTGKELAARAIHRHSRRAGGPFVAVNLASLSETLAESELFGHVRGAFTGADESRKGLLEHANGGTVFLDEVADIPAAIQIKLLRALEHGEVLPVGGNQSIRSDFRVISATHQNLDQLVAAGTFRHDLYYRLITFEIEMPPLRNRREDIDLLCEHFLDILAAQSGQRTTLTQAASDELRRRYWHGNVRELRNAVEHATVLARGAAITPEHFPAPLSMITTDRTATAATGVDALGTVAHNTASESQTTNGNLEDLDNVRWSKNVGNADIDRNTLAELVRRWVQERLKESSQEEGRLYDKLMEIVEPPLIKAAMEQSNQQCSSAARRLGLHRTTLRKKLDQFGL